MTASTCSMATVRRLPSCLFCKSLPPSSAWSCRRVCIAALAGRGARGGDQAGGSEGGSPKDCSADIGQIFSLKQCFSKAGSGLGKMHQLFNCIIVLHNGKVELIARG